jgi:hypothetical protein
MIAKDSHFVERKQLIGCGISTIKELAAELDRGPDE